MRQIYGRTTVRVGDHFAVVVHGEAILDHGEIKFIDLIESVLSMCPHNAE